jgi:hypothetical protein
MRVSAGKITLINSGNRAASISGIRLVLEQTPHPPRNMKDKDLNVGGLNCDRRDSIEIIRHEVIAYEYELEPFVLEPSKIIIKDLKFKSGKDIADNRVRYHL